MKHAALTLAVIVSAATFLPMLRSRVWWIRIFDFPRIQVAVLAAIAIVIWLSNYRVASPPSLAVLGVSTFCFIYQTALMLPYTRVWKHQVQAARSTDPRRRISLLLANVLMTNRNAQQFLDIIGSARPDIVLAVETNQWWLNRLMPLKQELPHTVFCPLENTYGMVLFSRLELIAPEVSFVVHPDVPSIHTRCRLASGNEVEMRFLHPRPPFPTETDESSARDAELLTVGDEVKDCKLPRIVAGDLNDVAWSRTTKVFQRISGLLDPRVGRGFFNTFHAMHPLLRFSLDHIFHSSEFRLCQLKVLPKFGSDHFPVLITLSYEPDAALEQPEPQPQAGDIAEKHDAVRDAHDAD